MAYLKLNDMERKNFTKKIKLEIYKKILPVFINESNRAAICAEFNDALIEKGFSIEKSRKIAYFSLPEIDKEMKKEKRTFYLPQESRVRLIKKQIKLLSK